MIITLETSMIFSVCMQIFVVSSMFLQTVINQSSMKKQWNISDSKVNTTKTLKIKNVAIETINFSNMSLQRIINDHRRSSIETSMFRRLSKKTSMIINVSIEVFAVTSMFLQIFINEMQGTSKEKTMIQRLTQQKRKRSGKFSIETISFSNMSLQSIINDHRRRSN